MIESLRLRAHRWLCGRGIHDWFRQHDRWGSADVCRYCVAVRDHTDGSGA